MAEQILLFHAFLIYKEITRKQQTENSFNKTLEGKKKNLEKTIKSRLFDVSSGEMLLQTELIRPYSSFC